uniref:complement component C8 gamma chain isoform X3 n=1 Tax=Ictidomys tridecemlineatus TaxID=43179 RepID=UPI001A9F584E|nr:complement component C8 gamma chain isoform X3 [Ictidomys tridecemlineatus]
MDFLGWASCGAGQWTLTWDIAALGLLIAATITMLPLETPLLLTLLLVANSLAQRVRPPRPPTLISSIQPKARFNAQQGAAMVINTSRKLDGICWQVRQLYRDTEVPGRFLLQAQGARAPVHMVVAATDYQGFAILYLERAKQLSVKLYARSLPVSDSVLSVFEQQVKSANLTEDQILYFPKYGFCKAADQFHILDGEWAAGQLASGHSAGSFLPLAESPVCCRSEGARPAGAVMGHLLPSSFQGQWFVLGLASNTYRREDRALLNTFSTTFGLNQKGHFEVSNTMTRGKRCNTWSYVLIPAAQPGHFTVDTKGEADPGERAGTGTFSEDVQVVDGDYTVFALLLSIRRMGSQTTIRISLLGRHWNLPRWTLDRFTCLVKAQGLTKDNIVFPTAIGNAFTGSGQWEMESRQAGRGLPEDPRLMSPAPPPEQAGSFSLPLVPFPPPPSHLPVSPHVPPRPTPLLSLMACPTVPHPAR